MGANIVASTELLYHITVLAQDRRGITAGVPPTRADIEESMSGFGSLKYLLKAIYTVYANQEVSPPLPASNTTLTDHCVGILHRGEQGRMAPLACSFSRRTFYEAPKLRG